MNLKFWTLSPYKILISNCDGVNMRKNKTNMQKCAGTEGRKKRSGKQKDKKTKSQADVNNNNKIVLFAWFLNKCEFSPKRYFGHALTMKRQNKEERRKRKLQVQYQNCE